MKLLNNMTTAIALSALLLSACGEINDKKGEKDMEPMETAENMEADVPNQFETENASTISGLTRTDDRFDTLNIALEKANLHSTLGEDTPYTVFAPTDEAFKNLTEGKLNGLFEEGNESELTSMLSYHVVSGIHTASDIKKKIEANSGSYTLETLEGGRITFTLDDSEIVLTGIDGNEARIAGAGVEASNGLIQGIDHVLMFK